MSSLGVLFLIGAPSPETLPELRIEIMPIGAGVSPQSSAWLERMEDHRRIASADLAPDAVFRFRLFLVSSLRSLRLTLCLRASAGEGLPPERWVVSRVIALPASPG